LAERLQSGALSLPRLADTPGIRSRAGGMRHSIERRPHVAADVAVTVGDDINERSVIEAFSKGAAFDKRRLRF
jgi:hypothetical protein